MTEIELSAIKEKNVTNIPDGLISEYEWNNIIGNLIYESTEIPNEDIVQNEEDKVYQTIKIFQNESNDIIVNATSNYVGFEDLQYTFRSNSKISKEDVKVKWLTLMGSQEASEDNARVIADVIISNDGNVISERKINFMSKAIDIVIDSIKQ